MPTRAEDPTAEVTDLLQSLIRNQCVNDGTVASGDETKSVDLLAGYLAGVGRPRGLRAAAGAPEPGGAARGLRSRRAHAHADGAHRRRARESRRLEPRPVRRRGRSRASCGAAARSTCSTSPRRRRSPSGGSPTAGSRPRARSSTSRSPTRSRRACGAPTGCSQHERDAVFADYVLTESGGIQVPTADGVRLPVLVGEKGTYWSKIHVHGTPGHGSQPFHTDNALVTAAEVVRRIAEYRPAGADPRRVARLHRGPATSIPISRRCCSIPRRSTTPSSTSRSGSRARSTRARTPRSRRRSRTAAPRPT